MHSKIQLRQFLFIAALAACAKGSDTPRTDAADTTAPAGQSDITPGPGAGQASGCVGTELRGDRVGGLRIGTGLESVKANCRVVRDTIVTASEGMTARKLAVEIAGEPVEAEIVDNKVWRISVKSPPFRTADSLGVGTPLSRLLQLEGARGMMGEGTLYFTSSAHCGLSFRLSENRPLDPSGNWNSPALARLPASTKVTEVLVFGCVR